jgi:hypothetical protein
MSDAPLSLPNVCSEFTRGGEWRAKSFGVNTRHSLRADGGARDARNFSLLNLRQLESAQLTSTSV